MAIARRVRVVKRGAGKDLLLAPDAGDTLVGLATSQTLTGKTLTSPTITTPVINSAVQKLAVETLIALGADQAGAAPFVSSSGAFVAVSGADASKGVRLLPAVAGMFYLVKNVDNAVLKVYPATGDAINALAANASLDVAALKSFLIVALDATTWYTISLLPS